MKPQRGSEFRTAMALSGKIASGIQATHAAVLAGSFGTIPLTLWRTISELNRKQISMYRIAHRSRHAKRVKASGVHGTVTEGRNHAQLRNYDHGGFHT
jgi:hypothetical protein